MKHTRSLTSFLSHKENQGIRDRLKNDFPSPKVKFETEIKAPPQSANYGIIGTAFDYLLRFKIEFLNQKIHVMKSGHTVAYGSYERLSFYLTHLEATELAIGSKGERIIEKEYLIRIISTNHEEAQKAYKEFQTTGLLDTKLIEASVFLAKLDIYFRTRIIDKNIDIVEPSDVIDLRNLYSLVNDKDFTANNVVYLNPLFDNGLIAHDADLVIDNTLIDIKVTKDLSLDRSHLNQIICYYIFSLSPSYKKTDLEYIYRSYTGVIEHDAKIENIGIYFARHGVLWKVPVSQLGDRVKFDSFKEWFKAYLADGNEEKNEKILISQSQYTRKEKHQILQELMRGDDDEKYFNYLMENFILDANGKLMEK